MILLTFLFSWFSLASTLEVPSDEMHDIHMSRCDIDYKTESKTIEVSMKMFIDDLELDLRNLGHDSLKICTAHEKPEAEELILNYLQQNLRITIDEQPTELHWIGKEISEDLSAVWCYLQISNVSAQHTIELSNQVLLSTFDDQQNVVKLKIDNGKRSFFLFDNKEYTGLIELM